MLKHVNSLSHYLSRKRIVSQQWGTCPLRMNLLKYFWCPCYKYTLFWAIHRQAISLWLVCPLTTVKLHFFEFLFLPSCVALFGSLALIHAYILHLFWSMQGVYSSTFFRLQYYMYVTNDFLLECLKLCNL